MRALPSGVQHTRGASGWISVRPLSSPGLLLGSFPKAWPPAGVNIVSAQLLPSSSKPFDVPTPVATARAIMDTEVLLGKPMSLAQALGSPHPHPPTPVFSRLGFPAHTQPFVHSPSGSLSHAAPIRPSCSQALERLV